MKKVDKDTAIQNGKAIAELVAGGSTFMVINAITGALLPPQVKGIVCLGTWLGGNLIGGMLSTHVCKYVDETIDATIQTVKEVSDQYGSKFQQLKEAIKEEPKIEELG